MSILSEKIEEGKRWLMGVALQKGLKMGLTALVAYLMSPDIAGKLGDYGIHLSEPEVAASLATLIEVLRNFLKTKFDIKWL